MNLVEQKRLEDLAVVWAESVYRNDMCMSFAQGSEQRETCETNAKAAFISRTPTYNERLTRIVKWIKLNHQLAEAIYPTGNRPSFRYSDGQRRFGELCLSMVLAHRVGSNGADPLQGCFQKIDGNAWKISDSHYQRIMLDGLLPNGDAISGLTLNSDFSLLSRPFSPSEEGHYDHFHIEQ